MWLSVVTGVGLFISLRLHIPLRSLLVILVSIISVQYDWNYFHYSGLSAFPVMLPTMYRVPARFSVVSVKGSELPEVQPVASVLSLLGRVPGSISSSGSTDTRFELPDSIPRINRPVRVHFNTETRHNRNLLLLIVYRNSIDSN